MISYTRDEIISASDMARGFSRVLQDIANHTKEKFAISKNNKLIAVVLSIDEYEKLKADSEMLEHIEMYKLIKDRKNSKTVTLKDSASKHGIDLDEL
ncbi:MAG: type II toxin-antitoxin system Phd/YefM family antitoxin [Campylobacterales bacterium]